MSFWPKTLIWIILVIAGFLFLRYLAHDPSDKVGLSEDRAKSAPFTSVRKEEIKETQGGDTGPQEMIPDADQAISSPPEAQVISTDVMQQAIDFTAESPTSSISVEGSTTKETMRDVERSTSQESYKGLTLKGAMKEVDHSTTQEPTMGSPLKESMRTTKSPIREDEIPATSVLPEEGAVDDARMQTEGTAAVTPPAEVTLPEKSVSAPMRGRPPASPAMPAYPRGFTSGQQRRQPGGSPTARERYYGYRQRPGFQRQPALSGERADKRRTAEGSVRQARIQRGARPYSYPRAPWGYRYPPKPYGGYRPYPFSRPSTAPAAPTTNSRQEVVK